MEIVPLDDAGRLFLSPAIDSWEGIERLGISVVFDMDGDLDIGVPTVPNHTLYVYFPIEDDGLPDLEKLHSLAGLGASLIRSGHKVLSHCGMGLNRSALVAGLIMIYLGFSGEQVVKHLRARRPGALFNENFATYLSALPSA